MIKYSRDNFDIKIFNNTNDYLAKDIDNKLFIFTGYFWIDDVLYELDEAISYLNNVLVYDDLSILNKIFNSMNGSWNLIFAYQTFVLLVSDYMRTIPIFYHFNGKRLFISDLCESIINDNELNLKKYDDYNIFFYKEFSTCFEGETIYEGLNDVTGGGYLYLNNLDLNIYRYWYMPSKKEFNIDEDYYLKLIDSSFNNIFLKMSKYFAKHKSKTILLALSGGMDSRFIAYALKKYNITNKILVFSFSSLKSQEVDIAKEVRNFLELGFDLEYVKYSDEVLWDLSKNLNNILAKTNMQKALPNFLTYIALKKISLKYDEDFIFVPGHILDNLTGFTLQEELLCSFDTNMFFHYLFTDKFAKQKLLNSFLYKDKLKNYEHFSLFNRLSSYIVNTVNIDKLIFRNVYMPFMDKELFELWYSLPTDLRYARNIFRKYLNKYVYINEYSKLFEIPLSSDLNLGINELSINNKYFKFFKLVLKTIMPKVLLEKYRYNAYFKRNKNHPFNMFELISEKEFDGINKRYCNNLLVNKYGSKNFEFLFANKLLDLFYNKELLN